jgi:hypothetical protein
MHTTESDVFMYIPSDEESKLLLKSLVVFEPGYRRNGLGFTWDCCAIDRVIM